MSHDEQDPPTQVHNPPQRKRLMIVIEETGEIGVNKHGLGAGFNVKLEGDIHRLGKIPDKDLSAAEFWGLKLFNICGDVLRQSGAVRQENKI